MTESIAKQGTFVLAMDVERFGLAAVMLAQLRWLYAEARHVNWVKRDGQEWIAYADNDWIYAVGLGARQARRARVKLEEAGLIEYVTYKSGGVPTTHIRLIDSPISASPLADSGESLDSPIPANPPLSETDETTEGNNARSPLRDVSDSTVASVLSNTFAETWALYPRKLNRKGAERAWVARVKAGANPADLYRATENYARIRAGEDPVHTMHGATFFGPNERWEDYLNPGPDAAAKPQPKKTARRQKADRLIELIGDRNANQNGLPA